MWGAISMNLISTIAIVLMSVGLEKYAPSQLTEAMMMKAAAKLYICGTIAIALILRFTQHIEMHTDYKYTMKLKCKAPAIISAIITMIGSCVTFSALMGKGDTTHNLELLDSVPLACLTGILMLLSPICAYVFEQDYLNKKARLLQQSDELADVILKNEWYVFYNANGLSEEKVKSIIKNELVDDLGV